MATARQGIRSLETGISMFRQVHALRRPATLTEIAKLSRMEPAKAHRYCVSLVRSGLLQQDGRGLYAIGPLGFSLSREETDGENARTLAIAALPDIRAQIGETVFLSCWGQTGPLILKVEDAPRPIAIRPTTKGDLPMLNSATGRVFAAFMEPQKVAELIERELAAKDLPAREREKQRRDFDAHVKDVRKRGLARTTGERYAGLISFAAPIFDHRGRVVLALTAFGLSATFPSGWNSDVAVALRGAAARLTQRIGGGAPEGMKANIG